MLRAPEKWKVITLRLPSAPGADPPSRVMYHILNNWKRKLQPNYPVLRQGRICVNAPPSPSPAPSLVTLVFHPLGVALICHIINLCGVIESEIEIPAPGSLNLYRIILIDR